MSRPPARGRRWRSFVADDPTGGRRVRALHEEANPAHRVRVEHDRHTILIHLSSEDGAASWTTLAVDRRTRRWAVAEAPRQSEAAEGAYESLYAP